MTYAQYQVDAFASEVFKGNPAAVVPLDNWIDDALMQNIALENNLSETAFIVKDESSTGLEGAYEIRWRLRDPVVYTRF
jgi:PhzF family phenazine biosynthesis protein